MSLTQIQLTADHSTDFRIVTGVMMFKQNRMIRLAISERLLLPFGGANATWSHGGYVFYEEEMRSWKMNQSEFKIDDVGVEEGADYHTLTFDNRGINLDTVIVPEGHVVTGVRFRVFKGRLQLEVRATQFDFHAGVLKYIGDSVWVANPKGGKNKIHLNNPLDSTKHPKRAAPNRTPDAYVEFGPSGNWADMGQTTVPFIDTQKVEPYSPVPLSGVGIYYRGHPGDGGFIAPKLVLYDYESKLVKLNRGKYVYINENPQ